MKIIVIIIIRPTNTMSQRMRRMDLEAGCCWRPRRLRSPFLLTTMSCQSALCCPPPPTDPSQWQYRSLDNIIPDKQTLLTRRPVLSGESVSLVRVGVDSRSMICDHKDDGAVIPGGLRVPLTVAVHHMMSLVTIIMSFVKCKDYEGSGSGGVLITMATVTALPYTSTLAFLILWGSSV